MEVCRKHGNNLVIYNFGAICPICRELEQKKRCLTCELVQELQDKLTAAEDEIEYLKKNKRFKEIK